MRALILLSLLFSFTFCSCQIGGEQEIIIVPKNFKGYIVVVFNQKDGKPIKYEGKKRVYEIPANGILKTQFEINEGFREFTEFYSEKISTESKLVSYAEFAKVPLDKVVGLMGSRGSANKDLEGKETIEFLEYYIGNKSEIDSACKKAESLDIIKLLE